MAAGKIEVGGAVVTWPRRHAARFLVRLPVAASIAPCSVARARWCQPAPLGVLFGDSAAHLACGGHTTETGSRDPRRVCVSYALFVALSLLFGVACKPPAAAL